MPDAVSYTSLPPSDGVAVFNAASILCRDRLQQRRCSGAWMERPKRTRCARTGYRATSLKRIVKDGISDVLSPGFKNDLTAEDRARVLNVRKPRYRKIVSPKFDGKTIGRVACHGGASKPPAHPARFTAQSQVFPDPLKPAPHKRPASLAILPRLVQSRGGIPFSSFRSANFRAPYRGVHGTGSGPKGGFNAKASSRAA